MTAHASRLSIDSLTAMHSTSVRMARQLTGGTVYRATTSKKAKQPCRRFHPTSSLSLLPEPAAPPPSEAPPPPPPSPSAVDAACLAPHRYTRHTALTRSVNVSSGRETEQNFTNAEAKLSRSWCVSTFWWRPSDTEFSQDTTIEHVSSSKGAQDCNISPARTHLQFASHAIININQ